MTCRNLTPIEWNWIYVMYDEVQKVKINILTLTTTPLFQGEALSRSKLRMCTRCQD